MLKPILTAPDIQEFARSFVESLGGCLLFVCRVVCSLVRLVVPSSIGQLFRLFALMCVCAVVCLLLACSPVRLARLRPSPFLPTLFLERIQKFK